MTMTMTMMMMSLNNTYWFGGLSNCHWFGGFGEDVQISSCFRKGTSSSIQLHFWVQTVNFPGCTQCSVVMFISKILPSIDVMVIRLVAGEQRWVRGSHDLEVLPNSIFHRVQKPENPWTSMHHHCIMGWNSQSPILCLWFYQLLLSSLILQIRVDKNDKSTNQPGDSDSTWPLNKKFSNIPWRSPTSTSTSTSNLKTKGSTTRFFSNLHTEHPFKKVTD